MNLPKAVTVTVRRSVWRHHLAGKYFEEDVLRRHTPQSIQHRRSVLINSNTTMKRRTRGGKRKSTNFKGATTKRVNQQEDMVAVSGVNQQEDTVTASAPVLRDVGGAFEENAMLDAVENVALQRPRGDLEEVTDVEIQVQMELVESDVIPAAFEKGTVELARLRLPLHHTPSEDHPEEQR